MSHKARTSTVTKFKNAPDGRQLLDGSTSTGGTAQARSDRAEAVADPAPDAADAPADAARPLGDGDAIEVIARLGVVCVREFDHALPRYQPDMVSYAASLPAMTDQELMVAAEDAIYTSALVTRFKGNWEHDHFKASACYSESERRAHAAGHDGCARHSIYDRAYRRAFETGTGQRPGPVPACTCPPAP